jgi:hypothetical protein
LARLTHPSIEAYNVGGVSSIQANNIISCSREKTSSKEDGHEFTVLLLESITNPESPDPEDDPILDLPDREPGGGEMGAARFTGYLNTSGE